MFLGWHNFPLQTAHEIKNFILVIKDARTSNNTYQDPIVWTRLDENPGPYEMIADQWSLNDEKPLVVNQISNAWNLETTYV